MFDKVNQICKNCSPASANIVLPTLTNPATAADIIGGKEALDDDGSIIVGSASLGTDTSDANATAADLASGKTAYVDGVKITGSHVCSSGGGGGGGSGTQEVLNMMSCSLGSAVPIPAANSQTVSFTLDAACNAT